MHECKICGETVKILGTHVKHVHKIKSEEYYIKYVDTSENAGKCIMCGKPTKFGSLNIGYYKTCSVKCGQSNPETRKKQEQTNMKKYGGKAPAMSKQVREKTIKTNRERYGVDAPYQNDAIKKKGIEVVKEKYGVENVFQLDEIKNKSRETNLEKYGVELNVLRPEIKNHIKRSKRTNKYDEFLLRLSRKDIDYLGTFDEYVYEDGIDRKYRCNLCNKEFTNKSTLAYDIQCGCLRRRSKGENEINKWLISLGYSTKQSSFIYDSDNRRLEIDILVEVNGLKFGIEYCGVYWHSELYRDKDYHKRKLDAANNNGIKLIQIFEDEWLNKKDLLKSMILSNISHPSIKKIGARKCKINKLHKTPSHFLEMNHIQGSVNSTYSYSLEYENEIVSVITFSKSRFDKSDAWECVRFCNKQGLVIQGGFSRLLKKFISDIEPSKIVSYADLRYFNGKVYEANGFVRYKDISIGYFYSPPGYRERLNRVKFQKHKLKHMKSYSNDKTEHQIMLEEGYVRVYDAGQSTYILEL